MGIRIRVNEFHSCFKMLNRYILLNSLFYHPIQILFDFALLKIRHFFSLTIEIFCAYACIVHHFQSGMAFFINCMIIFKCFIWDESFSLVSSNRDEVFSRFTVMKFLPVIVMSFFCLSYKIKQVKIFINLVFHAIYQVIHMCNLDFALFTGVFK